MTLPMVIINDGRVIHRNLTACGRDENWLRKQLSQRKKPPLPARSSS